MAKKKKRKLKKNRRIVAVSSLVVAVVVAGYILLCIIAGGNDFIGNTVINGVNVSDMTKQEAIAALENQYNKDNVGSLTLSVNNDKKYSIETKNVLSFDAKKGVEDVYNEMHSSFFRQGILYLLGSEYSAPVSIKDQKVLEKSIKNSGILSYDTCVLTKYNILDNAIEFIKGKEGVTVSLESVVHDITNALAHYNVSEVIECTLEKSGDFSKEMERLYAELNNEGVNATLDKKNNYAIVPSRVGVDFNLDDAKKAFTNIGEGQICKVNATITQPKVTTEDLQKNLFKDVLGSYTTYVSGSTVRRNNVKLAGDKCNETILLPGEEFSYNKVVGERTKANGFGEAAAYLNGLTIQEVGGGVCQPSSTLYNSVMLANLDVTERSPHSYISSYVPIGRDATVSWGGPDFKFKNNTDYPIKVTSVYKNNNLTMKIHGTNLENITVKITSEQLTSKPYNTIEKKDPTLEVGKTRVEVSGYTGATAQSYRHVYKNGVLISSKKEAFSSYKKRDKVVYVGTKPVPKPVEPPVPPVPEDPTAGA